ncbi:hypothetical protein EC991_003824 [Linnemannia zychae]|nr:hypothetical protein EC991_003824 [Linnemannia zychae]
MEAATFSGLPVEIQELVGLYLRPHDLTCCVLVSKDWQTLFNPYLWKHIGDPAPRDFGQTKKGWERAERWNQDFSESITTTKSLTKNAELIQSIRFACYDDDLFTAFMKCCPEEIPYLHKVEICGVESDDKTIAAFLKLSKCGWKKIIFQSKHPDDILGLSNQSMKVILKHVNTLEVLRLMSLFYVKNIGEVLHEVLCSAPLLREFYVIPGSRSSLCEPFRIDGVKIANAFAAGNGWKCTELQVFGCHIGGIPRPDITRDICGNPPSRLTIKGTLEESHRIHRSVYGQLAQLTKLRTLVLGCPFDPRPVDYLPNDRESARQYQCLAMTLESGLDLLKGLKNLEDVGLSDMEVGIDENDEEIWIDDHWPNIAQVDTTAYETDFDNYYDDEDDDEWYSDDF